MSELAQLYQGPYRAPEDAVDYGERYADQKKFLLYLGEKAIVDVVECYVEDGREVLGAHILRVMDSREKGPNMLHHTSLFVPEELAKSVFDPPKAA